MILVHQIQPEIKGSNAANINSVVLDSPGDREAKLGYMSNTVHKGERKTVCTIVQVVYCVIRVAPRDVETCMKPLRTVHFLSSLILYSPGKLFFFLPSKLLMSI